MVFNSVEFAVFLPLVFILYWTVLRKRQNALLLVGSYLFYGWWDWRFLGLIIISTVTDFFVAQAIEDSEDDRRRRWRARGTASPTTWPGTNSSS